MLSLSVGVLKHHFEHLREVLAKMMRGGTLDTTTTDGHVTLDRGRVDRPRKPFIFRLAAADDGQPALLEALQARLEAAVAPAG